MSQPRTNENWISYRKNVLALRLLIILAKTVTSSGTSYKGGLKAIKVSTDVKENI